jgi:hypothetical protein
MKKITSEDTKRPQKAQGTIGAFCGAFYVFVINLEEEDKNEAPQTPRNPGRECH